MQGEGTGQGERRAFEDPSVGIFISLYLILVAFFMVLNSISNQETARAAAVMESVNSTFKKTFQPKADVIDLLATPDAIAPNDEYMDAVRGLLAGVLELEGRFPAPGGNTLTVDIPVTTLFAGGAARVRQDRLAFVEQLIELIQLAPSTERREVAFILGTGVVRSDARQERYRLLAMRRAGSLARSLRARGLADGALTVGLIERASNDVTVIFRTGPVDQMRVTFADGEGAGR